MSFLPLREPLSQTYSAYLPLGWSYQDRANESAEEKQPLSHSLADKHHDDADGSATDKLPFPLKLHYMLEKVQEENQADIVSFQPHGRCFLVHDHSKFISEIMPKYFATKKYASFQRQLNIYGFTRLTCGRDKGAYYHELFLRGKPSLARRIRRQRIKGNKVRAPSKPEQEPNFYSPLIPPVGGGGADGTNLLSSSLSSSSSSSGPAMSNNASFLLTATDTAGAIALQASAHLPSHLHVPNPLRPSTATIDMSSSALLTAALNLMPTVFPLIVVPQTQPKQQQEENSTKQQATNSLASTVSVDDMSSLLTATTLQPPSRRSAVVSDDDEQTQQEDEQETTEEEHEYHSVLHELAQLPVHPDEAPTSMMMIKQDSPLEHSTSMRDFLACVMDDD